MCVCVWQDLVDDSQQETTDVRGAAADLFLFKDICKHTLSKRR